MKGVAARTALGWHVNCDTPSVPPPLKGSLMQNTIADPVLATSGTRAQNNRWIQLLAGVVCMMAVSSPQYVWTLFTKTLVVELGTTMAQLQVTFSILIVLQTFFRPSKVHWLIASGHGCCSRSVHC